MFIVMWMFFISPTTLKSEKVLLSLVRSVLHQEAYHDRGVHTISLTTHIRRHIAHIA